MESTKQSGALRMKLYYTIPYYTTLYYTVL